MRPTRCRPWVRWRWRVRPLGDTPATGAALALAYDLLRSIQDPAAEQLGQGLATVLRDFAPAGLSDDRREAFHAAVAEAVQKAADVLESRHQDPYAPLEEKK